MTPHRHHAALLFMDSCGPLSALQQLSKHSATDRLLQADVARQQQAGPRAFAPQQDARLQQEFAQFQQPSPFEQQRYEQMYNQQFPSNARQQHMADDRSWAQAFGSLSIAKPEAQQWQQQPQQGSVLATAPAQALQWQQQFVQNQQHHQPQRAFQPGASLFASSFMQSQRMMAAPQPHAMLEHQETHRQEQEQAMYDREFAAVEREMAEAPAVLQQPDVVPPAPSAFADTARMIEQTMQQGPVSGTATAEATHNKFHQSNFLKLMRLIADREVVLDASETKLVTAEGVDVRDTPMERSTSGLTDQTRLVLETPVLATPAATQLHLPDPLAHIPNQGLAGMDLPFAAAQYVMAGHRNLDMEDWAEDYRHTPPPERDYQWHTNYDGEDMHQA